ncbi:MAG TPA: LTA synthase family protein [Patescibacteria group bacterium]|nr:LTA synthase family protein [Patescibacteria group bacterium]
MKRFKTIWLKLVEVFYVSSAAFLIISGWNWYHLPHKPLTRFIVVSFVMWLVVFGAYYAVKYLGKKILQYFRPGTFWSKEFQQSFHRLFLVFSLAFLVFFIRNEFWSLVYFLTVIWLFYSELQDIFKGHHNADSWHKINRYVFTLFFLLFILNSVIQYFAFQYYILDASAKLYGVVLFRAWTMTMFWLAGVAVTSILYLVIKNKLRYLFIFIWVILFAFALLIAAVNSGILYYSGLYFGPVVLAHAEGGSGVYINTLTFVLIGLYVVSLVSVTYLLARYFKTHPKVEKRYWLYYDFVIIIFALGSIFGLTSFKTTPEYAIVRSFYEEWLGVREQVNISPLILKKLERFGLKYNLNEFNITTQEKIFSEEKKLLPDKFNKTKPNILVVFLESFSFRLTSVYNPAEAGLTPGLEKMAANPKTTIFKNYYNASTPTVTGLLSQLCSFLPPTGHEEIAHQGKVKTVRLSCLPEILRTEGGYNYASYITAVEKDFANKDTLMASMGVDEVYGTEELAEYIQGEPLSWGYSDHQLFPVTQKFMQEKAVEPFFMMLSTVDTHPPFTKAKDMVYFNDGKSVVRNSVHTTDDAFRLFWEDFVKSKFYDNTIVIAVADHAIFPTAYGADHFPTVAGKMTFYDENTFLMYIPESVLPKTVDGYSSGLDFAPTILQMLNINTKNTFEGHSIFADRKDYPNLLGMHEFGLYINEAVKGKRMLDYYIPRELKCPSELAVDIEAPLTLCEFKSFYNWKRQMFEEGRLWLKSSAR